MFKINNSEEMYIYFMVFNIKTIIIQIYFDIYVFVLNLNAITHIRFFFF